MTSDLRRHRRLDKLIALSRDPSATEAERALAAEYAAKIQGVTRIPDDQRYVEVGDELLAAMDRAMARAAGVRHRGFRAARVRAAEHRLGRDAMKQWRDGRGTAIGRGA